MELTNNDKYFIAEYIFAHASDTLIKKEGREVVKVLEKYGVITSDNAKMYLAQLTEKEIEGKDPNAYLEALADEISIDSVLGDTLYNYIFFHWEGHIQDIMNEYVSRRLTYESNG